MTQLALRNISCLFWPKLWESTGLFKRKNGASDLESNHSQNGPHRKQLEMVAGIMTPRHQPSLPTTSTTMAKRPRWPHRWCTTHRRLPDPVPSSIKKMNPIVTLGAICLSHWVDACTDGAQPLDRGCSTEPGVVPSDLAAPRPVSSPPGKESTADFTWVSWLKQ